MAVFQHTVDVQASPEALLALVGDPRRMAALFPYMTVEDISAPEPGVVLYWRRLDLPSMAELAWRERIEPVDAHTLRFRAVEGALETFAGHWSAIPNGGITALTLKIEYEVPATLAPRVPAMLVGYVMGEMFRAVVGRVKENAECGMENAE